MSPGLELPPPNCPRGAEGLGQPAPGQGQLGDSSGTARGWLRDGPRRQRHAETQPGTAGSRQPAGFQQVRLLPRSQKHPRSLSRREASRENGSVMGLAGTGEPRGSQITSVPMGGTGVSPHRCRGACRELSGGRRWDGEDFCSTWELTHLPAMGSGWARCLWSSLGAPKSPCSIPMQYPLRP